MKSEHSFWATPKLVFSFVSEITSPRSTFLQHVLESKCSVSSSQQAPRLPEIALTLQHDTQHVPVLPEHSEAGLLTL